MKFFTENSSELSNQVKPAKSLWSEEYQFEENNFINNKWDELKSKIESKNYFNFKFDCYLINRFWNWKSK